jgi:hypothetical protein
MTNPTRKEELKRLLEQSRRLSRRATDKTTYDDWPS